MVSCCLLVVCVLRLKTMIVGTVSNLKVFSPIWTLKKYHVFLCTPNFTTINNETLDIAKSRNFFLIQPPVIRQWLVQSTGQI